MQKIVHRAIDRGVSEHGWLHSRFSFSFADWYEPTRMGFGALRVINDDIIDPASGFGMHPHRDMEIITIVRRGAVTHEDSMGNTGVVNAGEVQVMSAGTGVVHSEQNNSLDVALELFQIWIVPDTLHVAPRYAQRTFGESVSNVPTLLVGPWGSDAPLVIHQNVHISLLTLAGHYTYILPPAQGLYVLVVSGNATVAGEMLGSKDAVGVWETDSVTCVGTNAELLIIEVPIR